MCCLQFLHLLPYIVFMRVEAGSQTIAGSYSSVKLVGRDDIYQVYLLNLVKCHCKKGEKLYRKA